MRCRSASASALDPDLAHVAHVEDARPVADGHVLVVDARELDRHIVPRELGHLGPRGDVILGECGSFHGMVCVFRFPVIRGASHPGAGSA